MGWPTPQTISYGDPRFRAALLPCRRCGTVCATAEYIPAADSWEGCEVWRLNVGCEWADTDEALAVGEDNSRTVGFEPLLAAVQEWNRRFGVNLDDLHTPFRVFRGQNLVARLHHARDAAAVVASDGGEIRWLDHTLLWHEGHEAFSAREIDAAETIICQRIPMR